ncbi:asparagine synthase (glutamine-hydrolyzing) [Caulobacter sp. AP07]|uniref:asparagine synthase-related protein n=1 Tax=Caulobacter sp. AP07 TaxID=1144304 RepID=UPI000271ED4A|nr:asparagine synthase-related protein [Caulobacter sp. AP07]EJL37544.1 asparagine synthase (glutamine-hydrolyzing) [Caulobacter sp. AP07]
MRRRFLLIAWSPERRVEAQRLSAGLAAWSSRAEGLGWVLLTPPGSRVWEVERGALAIGAVFPRLDGGRSRAGGDKGRRLLEAFWGGYVAVLDQADHVEVLRDPSGAAPAYWIARDGLTVVGSSLEVLLDLGGPAPRVDWPAVADMIAYPQVRAERTGLEQVRELLPGQSLRIRLGGPEGAWLSWSPWRFAAPGAALTDRPAATEALRTTVAACVAAWAGEYSTILLELSGGLDSSIIAASLRLAGRSVDCVNIVTPTAEGDERGFARLAAQGHRLHERAVFARGVDVRQARVGRLPRPGAHALLRPIETAFVETARAVGAEAFFSGLGGDNVFCSLSSAAPASDALLTAGPGPRFFKALDDLSRLHACTPWTAGQLALRKAFRSGAMGRLPADASFLAPGRAPARPPHHPWMTAPTGALPGKHDHIRSLLLAQAYLDRYAHAAQGPVVFPLLSQPIVELCLRIPTWLWIADGQNRAMARDAFDGPLPETVVRRRSKGGLNAFVAAVFEDNLGPLADQLLGGRLDRAGLIDAAAVRAVLANPGGASGKTLFRLLQLADVEAWARTWAPD